MHAAHAHADRRLADAKLIAACWPSMTVRLRVVGAGMRRSALNEPNADAGWLAPDDLAVALEVIGLNDQRELIGNADHALHLDHGAEWGEVLDRAGDPRGAVECNRAGLECALARRGCAAFEHGTDFPGNRLTIR